METMYIVIFFILGLLFGSFFNVVGLRVPKSIPFTVGRSYCPNCKQTLSAMALVPLFSYLFQRGKCVNCQVSISKIYSITELSTALLFAFSYYKIGFEIELLTAIILMSMLMIIFVTDISYMLIPNNVLLFFLPLLVFMRIINPLTPWYDSLLGAGIGFLLIAVIIIVSRGGMGGGDMKLFGVLGVVLGLSNVLLTFFLATLFGAFVGGSLLYFKVIDRKQPIPFGPYIIVAAIIAYFYGEPIVHWYLSLIG